MINNPYETLGVKKDASKEEIKKAYRNLCKEHHPDKGGDTKEFHKIELAYSILSDDNKRADFDKYGEIRDQSREKEIYECFMMLFKEGVKADEFDIKRGVKLVYRSAKKQYSRDIRKHGSDIETAKGFLKRIKKAPEKILLVIFLRLRFSRASIRLN